MDEIGERRRCTLLRTALMQRWGGSAHTVSRAGKPRTRDTLFSWDDQVEVRQTRGVILPAPMKCKIDHDRLEALAQGYPDQLAVALALDTIRNGATIGFHGDRTRSRVESNHASAIRAEREVLGLLEKDQRAGTLSQWYDVPPFQNFVGSPIGAVPKEGADGFRLVKDQSFSSVGPSVNESIEKVLLEYELFDDAVASVKAAGVGAKLIKMDVKSAFRTIGIRPHDWHLMGITWTFKDGKIRFAWDLAANFGCRRSPPAWDRIAKLIAWILRNIVRVPALAYFVDDYLIIVPCGDDPDVHMAAAMDLFEYLGVPLAREPEKLVHPTTSLTYLGVGMDTVSQRLFVPEEKRARITVELKKVLEGENITKKRLESIIGQLENIAKVMQPGRPFISRLRHKLARSFTRTRFTRIDSELRQDLKWWVKHIQAWEGWAFMNVGPWSRMEECSKVTTDACNIGQGGTNGTTGEWFSALWHDHELARAWVVSRISMPVMELRALVTAAKLWSHQWEGKRILFECDCEPVVVCVNKGHSRSPQMCELLRELSSLAIERNFVCRATHIAGADNVHADLLSRDRVQAFLQRSTSTLAFQTFLPGQHAQR